MNSGRSDPVVLDASAVIAALYDEPGAAEVRMLDRVPAIIAAEIHARGRKRGLSLADAACLATARAVSAEAWRADTAWRGLDVGVTIRLTR